MVKKTLILLAWLLLGISVARGVLALSGGTSLGQLLWSFAIPMICFIGLVFLKMVEFGEPVVSLRWTGVRIAQTVLVLLIAFTIACGVIFLAGSWSRTNALIFIVTVLGILVSYFLSVIRSGPQGFVLFLLFLPFVEFLESNYDLPELLKTWQLGPMVFTPSFILLLVFLFVSATGKVTRVRLSETPIEKCIAALAIFLLVASALSSDPLSSLRVAIPHAIIFPLIYFLIIGRVRSYAHVEMVFYGLVGYALLRLALMYYFFVLLQGLGLDPSTSWRLSEVTRIIVTSLETLPTIALFVLPMCVSLLVRTQSLRLRFLFGISMLFSSFILFESGQRNAILSLLLTIPFILFYRGIPRLTIAMLMVIGLLVTGALSFHVLQYRFTTYSSIDRILADMPVYQRLDAWVASVRIMIDHPLGVGFGGFPRLVPSYPSLSIVLRHDLPVMPTPHNWYLDYGVAGGWGALASLLALLITVERTMFSQCRRLRKAAMQDLAVGLFWSFSALLVMAVSAGDVFSIYETRPVVGVGILYWTTIGLSMALYRLHQSEES